MDTVSGEPISQGPIPAPKGRRFAAGVIDLFIIPILLGIVVGMMLVGLTNDFVRSLILVLINIGWILIRDSVYSPGRAMVGSRVASLAGDKVSVVQALIRNIFLLIPFVLVPGYFCETARVFINNLTWRRVVYVILLLLALVFGVPAILSGQGILASFAMLGVIVTPILFLALDKGQAEGDRLMDAVAKTRVVSA